MAEMEAKRTQRHMRIRHRGRSLQISICLGKQLRMFVYQNDWKLLPMAALIAGLVGMVIRTRLFLNMEGTLTGAFSLIMVCIWNGFFNSIQVICREREVIKREHRSGMHISSYITAHMIYQAMLCLMQTIITLYITSLVGVKYPAQGMFTRWMIVDFGISLFLITYAADMMSLWISSIARTTTAAMTIMPFVLIFQLVFSGGMFVLPEWTDYITPLTISNPGLNVVVSQSDYNSQPVIALWDQVTRLNKQEIRTTFSVGQILDVLQNKSLEPVAELRAIPLKDISQMASYAVPADTLGDFIDIVAKDPSVTAHKDESYSVSTTVGDIVDFIGEEKVADILQYQVAKANYNPQFVNTKSNILHYWLRLCLLIVVFAVLACIFLEFIDKDKR